MQDSLRLKIRPAERKRPHPHPRVWRGLIEVRKPEIAANTRRILWLRLHPQPRLTPYHHGDEHDSL